MSKALGWDPGTMFFQIAEKNGSEIDINVVRNSFVEHYACGDYHSIGDWHTGLKGKACYCKKHPEAKLN